MRRIEAVLNRWMFVIGACFVGAVCLLYGLFGILDMNQLQTWLYAGGVSTLFFLLCYGCHLHERHRQGRKRL